jgi:hypothetical protein
MAPRMRFKIGMRLSFQFVASPGGGAPEELLLDLGNVPETDMAQTLDGTDTGHVPPVV